MLAARRALWSPRVAAGGDLSAVQTSGTLDPLSSGPPFEITRPNALNWSVRVSASLPLFAGGARFRGTQPCGGVARGTAAHAWRRGRAHRAVGPVRAASIQGLVRRHRPGGGTRPTQRGKILPWYDLAQARRRQTTRRHRTMRRGEGVSSAVPPRVEGITGGAASLGAGCGLAHLVGSAGYPRVAGRHCPCRVLPAVLPAVSVPESPVLSNCDPLFRVALLQ